MPSVADWWVESLRNVLIFILVKCLSISTCFHVIVITKP